MFSSSVYAKVRLRFKVQMGFFSKFAKNMGSQNLEIEKVEGGSDC